MCDAIQAVETAIFLALGGNIVGAPVYQHPPQDASWPLVVIGDIDGAQPIGFFGNPDRIVPIQIVVATEGRERAPCTMLVAQVVALLDDVPLSHGGFNIRATLDSETVNNSEDGKGYVGIATFRVFALAD